MVFDSIRHPKEAQYLKDHNVHLIEIAASLETRYQRIQKRQHDTDLCSFETFKRLEDKEKSGQSKGQNISKTFTYCSQTITNDSTPEILAKDIQFLLNQLIS